MGVAGRCMLDEDGWEVCVGWGWLGGVCWTGVAGRCVLDEGGWEVCVG